MIETKSRFRVALGMTMIAGTVVLAGCATPSSRTSTTQQSTMLAPVPSVEPMIPSTEATQQPVRVAHVYHHHHANRVAMNHHHRAKTVAVTDDKTTTTSTATKPVASTKTARKSTESTTSTR